MNSMLGLPERYRIEEMLSRRALSRAFRATDLQSGDSLVVKSVRYPAWVSSFERLSHQRRTTARLQFAAHVKHPDCPDVRAVEEGAFSIFVARDWVDGRPLSDQLREQGTLPAFEVARIARKCSGAIDALAAAGLRHGSLTSDNLILCSDGSVQVTDPCFSEEVGRIDLAGALCDLQDRPRYGSDITALAEILLASLEGIHGANDDDLAAKRMVSALQRARRERAAYKSAESLADALTTLSTLQIARRVWRPATATGLFAALATVGTLALPDEKSSGPQPSSRTARHAAAVPTMVPFAPATQDGPKLSDLSAENQSWLALVVRRYGVSALARPTVAEVFRLNTVQLATVRSLLSAQRDEIAAMVENAAVNQGSEPAVIRTGDVRQQTTDRVLAALTPAQRDLWLSLAGQEPAQGEPLL